jgi:hypothetical protein
MADDKDKKEKGAKGKDGGAAKGGAAAKRGAKAAAKPEGKKASKGEGAPAAAAGGVSSGRPRAPKVKPRLATFYRENVRPALMEKFQYQSHMQAPRMENNEWLMASGIANSLPEALQQATSEMHRWLMRRIATAVAR